MSARLRSALTHLPPKQADVFCLHCLEGFSYREVAEQLDESVENIGVLLHAWRRCDSKSNRSFQITTATTTDYEIESKNASGDNVMTDEVSNEQ